LYTNYVRIFSDCRPFSRTIFPYNIECFSLPKQKKVTDQVRTFIFSSLSKWQLKKISPQLCSDERSIQHHQNTHSNGEKIGNVCHPWHPRYARNLYTVPCSPADYIENCILLASLLIPGPCSNWSPWKHTSSLYILYSRYPITHVY